jgi:hypothetical protein
MRKSSIQWNRGRARPCCHPCLYVLEQEKKYPHPLTVSQAKVVDDHPVVWLGFEEDCILTTCKNGESTNFLTAIASRAPSLARST